MGAFATDEPDSRPNSWQLSAFCALRTHQCLGVGHPVVRAWQRVGEDFSERLDIVPAQFFVQRKIRGKWACKCCQILVQEPGGTGSCGTTSVRILAEFVEDGASTPWPRSGGPLTSRSEVMRTPQRIRCSRRARTQTVRWTVCAWRGVGPLARRALQGAVAPALPAVA